MGEQIVGPIALVGFLHSTRLVEICIWIGLCTLSLSLLILAWTRWGNVKTTSKCIWLSIFAHVLLVLYAYETRLFLPGAGSEGGEAIVPITLITDSADSDDGQPETPPDPVAPAANKTDEISLADLQAPQLLEQAREPDIAEESEVAALAPSPIVAPSLLESPDDKTVPVEETEVESMIESSDQVTLGAPVETDSNLVDASRHSAETEQATTFEPLIGFVDTPPSESIVSVDSAEPASSASSSAPVFRASRHDNPQPIAEIYSLRNPEQRRQNALKRGGTDGTEDAVERALAWLVDHQQADGRWNPRQTEAGREFRVLGHDRQGAGGDADTAITGLALLALMGAGHDHLQGKYRDNVRSGLEFILKSQRRSGHLAGDASLFAHMYSHGIATLAVSEAFALTGDARLKPFVERAVAYSLSAQDPRTGGWRYQPGEAGDMSQFGWQVMALCSAQLGGTEIPVTTVTQMKVFLDLCSSGRHMGLAAYRPRQSPSPTMTAEALACRYFLGQSVADRTSDEAAEFIVGQPPGSGEIDYYLWYYATLSLYQKGGPHWEQWNRQLQTQLLETQVEQGNQAGSWEPNGKWCGYGGRVFSTALATMCLEVYYRYLPMLREQVAWNREATER